MPTFFFCRWALRLDVRASSVSCSFRLFSCRLTRVFTASTVQAQSRCTSRHYCSILAAYLQRLLCLLFLLLFVNSQQPHLLSSPGLH